MTCILILSITVHHVYAVPSCTPTLSATFLQQHRPECEQPAFRNLFLVTERRASAMPTFRGLKLKEDLPQAARTRDSRDPPLPKPPSSGAFGAIRPQACAAVAIQSDPTPWHAVDRTFFVRAVKSLTQTGR